MVAGKSVALSEAAAEALIEDFRLSTPYRERSGRGAQAKQRIGAITLDIFRLP